MFTCSLRRVALMGARSFSPLFALCLDFRNSNGALRASATNDLWSSSATAAGADDIVSPVMESPRKQQCLLETFEGSGVELCCKVARRERKSGGAACALMITCCIASLICKHAFTTV